MSPANACSLSIQEMKPDLRVVKQISVVLDQMMSQQNSPAGVIQGIPRINEVSSHFEDLMRELLNKTPGLICDFPKTSEGRLQRSAYPDLELIDQESHRVYYLDPKLYAIGSRDSSFRTFYFEPKIATNTVREDPAQLLALVISQVTTPETFEFDAVDDVVADVASGKIVIVTDDADRENEGDLVMAAEKATAASVNFMAMHGRGLICVPISNERAEQLGLKRMVAENREMYSTDFTVSVDAADGVTTGISAHDRARTIQVIANPISEPNDLVQPGHVFPLRAKDGGVLRRAGHTEAAVDLATMAGLQPSGVW